MTWEKILEQLAEHEAQYLETADRRPLIKHLLEVRSILMERREDDQIPLRDPPLLLLVGEYNSIIRNLPLDIQRENNFSRIGYGKAREER